jgi:hypothetical protein
METPEVRRYKFLIGPPLNLDAADMLRIRLHEMKKNECNMKNIEYNKDPLEVRIKKSYTHSTK